MNDFYIMSSCEELRQGIVDAQQQFNAANDELTKAKNALAEAEKKLSARIPFANNIDQLKMEVELALKLFKIKEEALRKAKEFLQQAEKNFTDSGLVLCPVQNACATNLTADLFTISIPDQTTDSSKEERDLADNQRNKDLLLKEIADYEECSKANHSYDWSALRYTPQATVGIWWDGNVQFTEAQLKDHIMNRKGPNGNPCASQTLLAEGFGILTSPTNWDKKGNNHSGIKWKLTGGAKKKLNILKDKINKDIAEKIKNANTLLEIAEENITRLSLLIQEYKNSNSVTNKKKKGEMVRRAIDIINTCCSKIKYSANLVITAQSGPMAPQQGGVSYSFQNVDCITVGTDGHIELDKDKAMSQMPKGGGCDDENDMWRYPANITATVTITDFAKITQCINGQLPILATNYGANGGNGTITISSNGTVTLTDCKGK